MMKHLLARIQDCRRLEEGQRAEGYGLRAASLTGDPPRYSSDPYLQSRFELGFRDGKSLLELKGPDGAS